VKKDIKQLIEFADWISIFHYKKTEEGLWQPMDLPFLYTTEEVVRDFLKEKTQTNYGKVRIDK